MATYGDWVKFAPGDLIKLTYGDHRGPSGMTCMYLRKELCDRGDRPIVNHTILLDGREILVDHNYLTGWAKA